MYWYIGEGGQIQHRTVVEAFQAAVVSLIEDESLEFRKSFFYWAAFVPHGCANVQLDDCLLDCINQCIINHQLDKTCTSHGSIGSLKRLTDETMRRLKDIDIDKDPL